jgi:hypothetical protein
MGVSGFFIPAVMNVEEERRPASEIEAHEAKLKTETAVVDATVP